MKAVDAPDVEGIFHLFAIGRTTAAGSKVYRPHHAVHENYLTSGLHEYLDRELLQPGQAAPVRVQFVSPEAYPRCLWIGREIPVHEASRIVGSLTITKIFNESLRGAPAQYDPIWRAPKKAPPLIDRLRRLFEALLPGPKIDPSAVPFRIGDRVRDIFGDKNQATVIGIDLRASHGLGRITVQYDDGRVISSAALAHGLELVPKE